MPLSQNKSQSEKNLMIILGFAIFIILIITTVTLLKNNSETKKPTTINKNNQNQTQTTIKKEKAPLISSPEVKMAYEKKFKEILNSFETELQKTGGLEKLDSSTIQEYKNILLQEIVPREYLDLHLDFVLMLDMVSNQQIAKAQDSLQKIKSDI